MSRIFALYDQATRTATSVKTMNTLSDSYIDNPQSIYSELCGYVDAAVNYKPRVPTDLDIKDIKSRTLELAVPEGTLSPQWRYIYMAILYGKEREVKVVVTRIRG